MRYSFTYSRLEHNILKFQFMTIRTNVTRNTIDDVQKLSVSCSSANAPMGVPKE